MADKYISIKNLKFLLHDVHKVSELSENYEKYAPFDRETVDILIDTAKQIGDKELHPYFQEMDKKHVPDVVDGKTIVHPQVPQLVKALSEGGWISAVMPEEVGGMGMPSMVNLCAETIFQAANNGAMFYTALTSGSAKLILSFGSQELKDEYLEKMLTGEWLGTMALTEPEAGSSLSDVVTSASPLRDGSYAINGQKIFISAGDNDFSENVIHLTLARIKGAPEGTKGISLFVVPKFRKNSDGELVPNDVTPAGVYHKMGQKATPAMHLIFGEQDDCRGYLVGEANKGLKYMFQMMNGARIEVGVVGAAVASAAYYASLQYAIERNQGRKIEDKDPSKPQVSIIRHADVKRMLLLQKAIMEGSLSLILEAGKCYDLSKVAEGEAKKRAALLLDLLTPIVKVYPSEEGTRSVSNGLQVLGGYGYTDDFPLEQMLRDMRITTLYEGTTGIQSMDLLGRKVMQAGGKSVQIFGEEITHTINEAMKHEALRPYAKTLGKEAEALQKVTLHLMAKAKKGKVESFLADANLYMELFSLIAIAWQWLKQATIAQQKMMDEKPVGKDLTFLQSKVHTMKFFFHYEIPKTAGLCSRLTDDLELTMEDAQEFIV